MRTSGSVAASFLLFSFSLLACSAETALDDDGAPPAPANAPSPNAEAGEVTSPAAPPSSSPTAPSTAKDVKGHVVDDRGAPVVGAPVAVVDANGKKSVLVTDGSGRFTAPAVLAPYDLRVSAPPASAKGRPIVFFGLTTDAPAVTHWGVTGSPIVRRKAVLLTAVDFPSCPSGYCQAQLWSGSKSGSGRTAMSFNGAAHRSGVIEIEHEWTGASTSDTVDVDVLLNDASLETYWHTKLETNAVVTEGGTVVLYAAAPKLVPRVVPIAIGAFEPTIPADWRKDMQVLLYVPGQSAGFYIASTNTSSLSTNLPDIPGSTFVAASWRIAPGISNPAGGYVYYENTSTVSERLPVSNASVVLEMIKGPSLLAPKPTGKLARSTGVIEWMPASGRVIQLTLSGPADRGVIAYTTSSKIAVGALAQLDVEIADGTHYLDLSTSEGATIERVFQPEFRAWIGTSRTDQSLAFDVVP